MARLMGNASVVPRPAQCGEAFFSAEPCRPLGYIASRKLVSDMLEILERVCGARAQFRLGVMGTVSEGRVSSFLRTVILPIEGAPADGADLQTLADSAAERIACALYYAYRITPATREAIRDALGVAPGELPLAKSTLVSLSAPALWARLAPFQPIIDRQLEQQSSSLTAFGLASIPALPGQPARASERQYRVSAVTLGVEDGSPIHAAIADQLCGRGAGVLDPAAPSDQPLLTFEFVTDPTERERLLNFGSSGSSPMLDRRHASLLLPLPQIIGRVVE